MQLVIVTCKYHQTESRELYLGLFPLSNKLGTKPCLTHAPNLHKFFSVGHSHKITYAKINSLASRNLPVTKNKPFKEIKVSLPQLRIYPVEKCGNPAAKEAVLS